MLVGDVTAGNPLVVSIADFELISCDYARGPLYRLAEADMERFQRAMEQRKGTPGQTVTGFFRSHTRKGISLDADDLAFYQACFREPHHIGLLIRPFATKASTAGIFIWENGKIHADASYLEFPFHVADLASKATEAPTSAPAAPPPPAASSSAAKPAARAQIVPIASRRDTPAETAPPVAAAPPPPMAAAPAAAPEPPRVEEKAVPAEPKGKFDKQFKKEKDKPAEPVKSATPAPAKASAPAAPAAPAKAVAPAAPAPPAKPAAPVAKPADKTEKIEKTEKAAEKAPAAAALAEEPKSGKGLKLVLAAVATISLFVGLFVYPGFLRHSTKTPVISQGDSSPLQLRVERSNADLLLTWNRDTDAIKNATKATLQITDGEQHENVDMDLSQLRNNGSIVYSPSSSDVSFRMEVIGRDQSKTTSETVRSLRTKQSALDTTAENKPAPAPAVTTPTPAPSTKTPNTPEKQASTATQTEEPAVQEPVKPVTPRREFNTASLSQRIRPAVATDIPDAPTVGGAVSAAIPGVSLPTAGAVPSAPIAPPTAPRPSAPAPSNPVNTQVVDPKNVKQGGNIQQAVLVSRKEPEYPKIAKQTGAKGVVTLNATIGKDGHIKAVKVVSGHPMLQNAAIEAVKQWVYKPTLLNGTPVETDTQIMLNFVGER
jgi:protein TonB